MTDKYNDKRRIEINTNIAAYKSSNCDLEIWHIFNNAALKLRQIP